MHYISLKKHHHNLRQAPMSCFHDSPKFETNDEYMTRKSAWEDIKEFIPTDKVIWECFMVTVVMVNT